MRIRIGTYKNFCRKLMACLLCFFMVLGMIPSPLKTVRSAAALEASLSGSPLGDTSMTVIVRHWLNGSAIGSQKEYTIKADGTVTDAAGNAVGSGGRYTITPLEEYQDYFKSFSLAAGQDAVTISGNAATVNYRENTHLVKVHLYYSAPGEGIKIADGFDGSETPERDVKEEDGEVKYDISPGLHTNKTAQAVGGDERGTRVFDLTLEAWISGNATAYVGLILDASASMSFVSNAEELEKIHVTGATPNTVLTQAQVDQILDKNYTDNSALGYGDYSYFVYNAISGTEEYVPLGYWDGEKRYADSTAHTNGSGYGYAELKNGDAATHVLLNHRNVYDAQEAGWYYVNGESKVHDTTIWDSGKQYRGLTSFETGEGSVKKDKDGYYPLSTLWSTVRGTKGASRFYVDTSGYLHCIFNPNSDYAADSYVYYLDDAKRIKTEELQNALGNFVNQLSAASETSEVSAVRFSAQQFDEKKYTTSRNYTHLYMLDWTKEPSESTGIMNLDRGGGTFDGAEGKGHNYVLTGGTYTYTGLLEFANELAGAKAGKENKYIILFTDGIDNTISGGYNGTSDAVTNADTLKRDEWTIYTVMLEGGFETTEHVLNYLYDISSCKSADGATLRRPANYQYDKYFVRAETGDQLNDKFESIMHQIVGDLEQYTVQDYLDPRFDLVDKDDTLIQLNAEGSILVGNTEKKINAVSGHPFTTQEGTSATLYYDGTRDMYFVKWENQNIPNCQAQDATANPDENDEREEQKARIWSRTIRVQAKEDFIGGNAVLTNGNLDTENMVYLQGHQADASSGTEKAGVEYEHGEQGPSKGFPRTTVNVKIMDPTLENDGDKFYQGETPEEFLESLIRSLSTAGSGENIYWNYLERYWDKCNAEEAAVAKQYKDALIAAYEAAFTANGENPVKDDSKKISSEELAALDWTDFDEFIKVIANALYYGNGSFTLPYSYLPDMQEEKQVNQTGSLLHESDTLGDITFTWIPNGTDSGELLASFDPYEANSDPQDENDRYQQNSDLIRDSAYGYDKEYKPTEAEPQEKTEADAGYIPEYIPGEIALQLKAKADDLDWLFENDWKADAANGKKFTVTVTRTDGETPVVVGTLEIVVKPSDGGQGSGDVYFYTTVAEGERSENGQNLVLPKGTYQLTFTGENSYGAHVRVNFGYAPDDAYDGHFARNGVDADDESDYFAPRSENSVEFLLGTDEQSENYLEDLYGMALIELLVDRGTLVIQKQFDLSAWEEGAYTPDAQQEFEFTVKLYASEANQELLTGTSYTYQVYDKDDKPVGQPKAIVNGSGTITLLATQYAKIENLPDDVYYVVEETQVTGFTTDFTVSGTVGHASTVEKQFVNKKEREPVTVSLQGEKLLTSLTDAAAPEIEEGDYTFVITPSAGNDETDPIKGVHKVSNDAPDAASGKALITLFDAVEYGPECLGKTYTYMISEEGGTLEGVKYSSQSYTVRIKIEEAYEGGKYTGKLKAVVTVVGGDSDTVTGNNTTVISAGIEFENQFDRNAYVPISGQKTLQGERIAPDQFTFTLEAVSVTGLNDGVWTGSGEIPMPARATVPNKEGGAFAFEDIKFSEEGIYTYTVKEDNDGSKKGYVFDDQVYTVKITVWENPDTHVLNYSVAITPDAQIEFDNAKLPEYDLTIGKTVEGPLGDKEKEFMFTVTLRKPQAMDEKNFPRTYALAGTPAAVAANGGSAGLTFERQEAAGDVYYTAQVKLKDEQTLTITGLPEGTAYEVSEEDCTNEGYGKDVTGVEQGTIGASVNVAYRNLNPYGGVTISKTVDSPEASDEQRLFTFTVTLRKPGNMTEAAFEAMAEAGRFTYIIGKTESGTEDVRQGSLVLKKEGSDYIALLAGQQPIQLAHDESINIQALPEFTTVFIRESETGFTTTMQTDGEQSDGEITITEGQPFVVEVLNDRDEGTLAVSKTVVASDEEGEIDEAAEFRFTVILMDGEGEDAQELTGEYPFETTGAAPEYAVFKSGSDFVLKHGETFKITGLPTGTVCIVMETPADGYKTEVSANGEEPVRSNQAQVTIQKEAEVTADYTNEKVTPPIKESEPESGSMRKVGDEIAYRITWENYKNDSADVFIIDQLVRGLDYQQGTAKAYRYNAEGVAEEITESVTFTEEEGLLRWTLAEQPARTEGYVAFTAVVNDFAVQDAFGNKVTNEADVAVNEDSWLKTNEVEHRISDPHKIEVAPGADRVVLVGSEITYEVTWENYKDEAARVTITDPLDPCVDFVKAKFGAMEQEGVWYTGEEDLGIFYDAEAHVVTWVLEDQPGGTAGVVTVVVRVKEEATLKGVVENQASVQVGDDPPVETEIIKNPTPKTGVSIYKEQAVNGGEATIEKQQVKAGDIVTYYVLVTNVGDIPAEDVIVTDPIPAGLSLVEGSISHGGANEGGVITWRLGTLAENESVLLSFRVKVPRQDAAWLNIASESHEDPEDPGKPRVVQSSNVVEIVELPELVPGTGEQDGFALFTMALCAVMMIAWSIKRRGNKILD